MKVAAYVRVSTRGQTLEQQIDAIQKYCAFRGWEIGETYHEKGSAYKLKVRPEWERCKADLRAMRWDGLILFRFDRAWRRSREMIMESEEILERGLILVSVAEGIDPTTPMGKAVMQFIGIASELERNFIAEATQDRLDALRNMGKKLGRARKVSFNDDEARHIYVETGSIRETARRLGAPYGTVRELLKARSETPNPTTKDGEKEK